MANTYYDSQLTAAEIEEVLEAINGLIVPANNGKILVIQNGKIVVKSVSEITGEGTVLEPLSVTANGNYYPESGVDGFNEVHVTVPSPSLGTITITQNGTYYASSENLDGYTQIVVDVQSGGGVEIVPWSTGTDEQIAAMVAALDAGTISIAETGWAIGDERVVSLEAMAATGVGESHAAQSVTMVLMDSQHYDLVGGGKDHFVVGLKNCLNETGYMNNTASNVGSWESCKRRVWCNSIFRAAIPLTLRDCFKQFYTIAASGSSSSALTTSSDYFSLFAEKEVLGSQVTSVTAEANALTQIAYYSTANNRKKTANASSIGWHLRSPISGRSSGFVCISSSGGSDWYGATQPLGIAPFGCI